MMSRQTPKGPVSTNDRLPTGDRPARIASLKKDAPSLGKRDRQTSVRSMAGAIFAALGVIAIVYAMGILDSVDRQGGDKQHLQQIDTIEAVPELRIDALIERIEREAEKVEEQRRQEWDAWVDLSERFPVDGFDQPVDAERSFQLEIPESPNIQNGELRVVPKTGIDDLRLPPQ